jgi:hypothetical protein
MINISRPSVEAVANAIDCTGHQYCDHLDPETCTKAAETLLKLLEVVERLRKQLPGFSPEELEMLESDRAHEEWKNPTDC